MYKELKNEKKNEKRSPFPTTIVSATRKGRQWSVRKIQNSIKAEVLVTAL